MGRDSEEGPLAARKCQEAKIGQLSASSDLVAVCSSEIEDGFPSAAHCTV